MGEKVSVVRRCKNIRDRVYDREQLPDAVFRGEVLKLITPDCTLVDIGCGRRAEFLHLMAPHVRKAYGIDLEVTERSINQNVEMLPGEAEAIPLCDETADIITMINVAEHLLNPRKVLLECKRVLKPGGGCMITTPNKYHPPILFGRAIPHRIRQWINVLITDTNVEDTFPAYYLANSSHALRCLASSTGLSVVNVRYLSNHPEYFMFSTCFYRCAVSVERNILQRETFAPLRQQILCHLEKAGGGKS